MSIIYRQIRGTTQAQTIDCRYLQALCRRVGPGPSFCPANLERPHIIPRIYSGTDGFEVNHPSRSLARRTVITHDSPFTSTSLAGLGLIHDYYSSRCSLRSRPVQCFPHVSTCTRSGFSQRLQITHTVMSDILCRQLEVSGCNACESVCCLSIIVLLVYTQLYALIY